METTVLFERIYDSGPSVRIIGKVQFGTLHTDMQTTIQGQTVTVTSIISDHKKLTEAEQGSSVGIELEGDFNLIKDEVDKTVNFISPKQNMLTRVLNFFRR